MWLVAARDVHCEFDLWPLAVSMPPTKVCSQCKAAVPVRWKTCKCCDHVFRSKWKAECNLQGKAMKRMRTVESDSVKSARKAKGKLHQACERVSEIHERTLHRQAHGKHERVTRLWLILVETQVQSHALLRQGFDTSVPFILLLRGRWHLQCLPAHVV